jgi:hypothetical protein
MVIRVDGACCRPIYLARTDQREEPVRYGGPEATQCGCTGRRSERRYPRWRALP